MTLHNIEDYRGPKADLTPCWVTFIWSTVRTPEGETPSFSQNLHITDGDFAGAIQQAQAVAEAGGGVYLTEPDANGDFWVLPWPPSAIRIRGCRPGNSSTEPER
jgi:hypothetical protein